MYTINYRLCGYSDTQIEKTFSAEDAQDAAAKLIAISHEHPISKMQFGEGKWISPKLSYYRHKVSRFDVHTQKRWLLDYSESELEGMIHHAMKNGGVIKAWHDPYFGTRF